MIAAVRKKGSRIMALHHVRMDSVTAFDYGFGGNIKGRMTDIGRNLGSQTIGLTIQTVRPGWIEKPPKKYSGLL